MSQAFAAARFAHRPNHAQRWAAAVVQFVFVFCIFFMLAFPKGGIKYADIPITIGYILIAPTALIGGFKGWGKALSPSSFFVLLPCFLMAAWSAIVVSQLGGQSAGFLIAYFITLLVLPVWACFTFNVTVLQKWGPWLTKAIVFAVRFIAIYGIFLFIYKLMTGQWIEIPYLTVNAGDLGALDEKHIDRGGVFKLISTYNNGNIFGVSMLILLPLYVFLEKRKLYVPFVLLSIILTLSRTAWIGLFIAIIFYFISKGIRVVYALYFLIGTSIVILSTYGVMVAAGLESRFLTDRNLGGRSFQLEYLAQSGFLPNERTIDLPEIVYIGIVYNYGVIGLALFLGLLMAPIYRIWQQGVPFFSIGPAAAAMQGMTIYVVVAASDAAYNFIPVMMIYWMIACIGLSSADYYKALPRQRGVRRV